MTGNHLTTHHGTYYHHGIDCGDGTVVHMTRAKDRIIRTTFNEFADGRHVHVENSQCDYSAMQVIERACSRVGESGYDIFNNNCEHFVVWCRTGKKCSQQVTNTYKPVVKTATRYATKITTQSVAKSGSKLIAKSLAKSGGVLLAADIAQLAIEQGGGKVGLSQEESQIAGKAVGLTAYVATGAVFGGPVGALVGSSVWVVGEIVGSLF